MPPARRRTRHSFGGRWTDQERSRLWNLRNSQRMLSWELFRANYFPNRSINALQKQYSDIKQHLQLNTAMNHSEPVSGNNNPVRTSERLKRPAGVPATGEPLSKQTRTLGPDTDDSSESDDSDSSTSNENGDWQRDKSQPELRINPRKPVPRPDRVVILPLVQRGNPHPPAPAAAGEQQPGVPTPSPSDPLALLQPPRTATPPVEAQPTTLQSPVRSLDTNEEPQSDKKSPSMSPSTKEAMLHRIGQWGKVMWEMSQSVKEHERWRRKALLLIEQLKKELKSEKEQVSHLDHLLEQKEGLLTQIEVEKKAYLDQIDGLTAELQDHKAKISQMPTNDPDPARPCPGCAEKEQQLDHFNQLRQFFEKLEKTAKVTPTPEATVPSSG